MRDALYGMGGLVRVTTFLPNGIIEQDETQDSGTTAMTGSPQNYEFFIPEGDIKGDYDSVKINICRRMRQEIIGLMFALENELYNRLGEAEAEAILTRLRMERPRLEDFPSRSTDIDDDLAQRAANESMRSQWVNSFLEARYAPVLRSAAKRYETYRGLSLDLLATNYGVASSYYMSEMKGGDDEFTGDLKKIMDDIAGGYIQFTKTAESGDVGVTRNTR